LFFAVYLREATVFSAEDTWPPVKEERKEYVFSNAKNAHVEITILSLDDRKLYDLQCHPGDWPKDPFFDYSGFFHCCLRSLYSEEWLGSLLTDSFDKTKEWENRGRFLFEHFLPSHENYRDWGRERHFLLRRMEITLKIWDESFEKKDDGSIMGINAFKFSVDIKNSPSSILKISEPPKKLRPKWFYGE